MFVYEWSFTNVHSKKITWLRRKSKRVNEEEIVEIASTDLVGNARIPICTWKFRCHNDKLAIKGPTCFVYVDNMETQLTEAYEIPERRWIDLFPDVKLQLGNVLYKLSRILCPTDDLNLNLNNLLGKRETIRRTLTDIYPDEDHWNPTVKKNCTHIDHSTTPPRSYYNTPFNTPVNSRTNSKTNNGPISMIELDISDDELMDSSDNDDDDEDNEMDTINNITMRPVDLVPTVAKKPNDLEDLVEHARSIFEDLDEACIREICKKYQQHENAIEFICSDLAEKDTGPNVEKVEEKNINFNINQLKPSDSRFVTNGTLYRDNFKTFFGNHFHCVPISFLSRIYDKHITYRTNENELISAYKEITQLVKEELEHYSKTHDIFPVLENVNEYPFNPLHYQSYTPKHFHFLKAKRKPSPFYSTEAFFVEQKKLLDSYMQEQITECDLKLAHSINEQQYKKDGALYECPTCCEQYAYENLTQCTDGHLFCIDCASKYAKTKMEEGTASSTLLCFSQGCEFSFNRDQMKRFLDEKSLKYFERQSQQNEIRSSSLNDLESCPFCDYCMIMEDENNSVFECLNADCKIKSCRKCKKRSHLPQSCEEAAENEVVSLRSKIANEMSDALVRECPSCHKRFVKESGCNKMLCSCGTIICYLCRSVITGYDHFNKPGSICKLHTDTNQDHEFEVEKAKKNALDVIQKNTSKDMRDKIEKDITITNNITTVITSPITNNNNIRQPNQPNPHPPYRPPNQPIRNQPVNNNQHNIPRPINQPNRNQPINNNQQRIGNNPFYATFNEFLHPPQNRNVDQINIPGYNIPRTPPANNNNYQVPQRPLTVPKKSNTPPVRSTPHPHTHLNIRQNIHKNASRAKKYGRPFDKR